MSDEIQPIIIGPPTGTVEAMALLHQAMHARMGMPICMIEDSRTLPDVVDLRDSLNFIQQSTIREFTTTMLQEIQRSLSIRTQAEYMGMRLENNRKRMRKRVRQRRRRWTILDEHWTNNPNGDW